MSTGIWSLVILSMFLVAPGALAQSLEHQGPGAVLATPTEGAPDAMGRVGPEHLGERLGDSRPGVSGWSRMGRYGAEVLGGLGGGLVAGIAAFGLGNLAMCGGFELPMCSINAGLWGGGLGGALGIVGGTWLVGHLMDGDGQWWAVLPGIVVSVGVAGVASQQISVRGEPFSGAYGAVMFGTVISSILLGALGYELSSHLSAKAFQATQVTLVPMAIPGAQGALTGGLVLTGSWN